MECVVHVDINDNVVLGDDDDDDNDDNNLSWMQ